MARKEEKANRETEKFDEKKLAFLYQEKTKSGDTSRFFKFVSREERR